MRMKVAIYARLSSKNQSEKSIDDQVRLCRRYIENNNLIFDERHVYIDESTSGSVLNRPGLRALEKAIENKEIEAVAVDDLSRLSRSKRQMLTLVNKFHFHQIKIISVSDRIVTDDDKSKLSIRIKGLINERYLEDPKKKTEKTSSGQKSYVHLNPKHLLQCKESEGTIVQVFGKGGRHYGCYKPKPKTCTNKLTIQKKRAEGLLLDNLKDVVLTAENLKYVYDNVEKEVTRTMNRIPEELRLKKHQCKKVQAQLQNLLNLIKVGNFSKTLSEALADAESCSEKLKGEMQGLEFQRTTAFKAPPREWIQFRLDSLHATLTQNGEAAALSLKNLLGRIELEPALGNCKVKTGKIIEVRSFYIAYTDVDTLALLEGDDNGSKVK